MDSTMAGMSKKKRPQRRSPAFILYVRINPLLGAALEQYIESLRPQPSLTSTVETFLEDSLARAGFWPTPDGEGKPSMG